MNFTGKFLKKNEKLSNIQKFVNYLNDKTTEPLKLMWDKLLQLETKIVTLGDTILHIGLVLVQFIFILGVLLFTFTKNNISILGGWSVFAYIIIFLTVFFKIILSFRKYYNYEFPKDDFELEKTFDNEMKFYQTIHKIFINIPSDIPFIFLISMALSSLEIISNKTMVSKNFNIILLFFGVPFFILLIFLLLFSRYNLFASKIMYSNIYYVIIYLIIYALIINFVYNYIVTPLYSTLFTKITEKNEEDKTGEYNISQNLSERFLIFKDPSSPIFDEKSSYYYILGIIFYIILIISQILLIYLFKDDITLKLIKKPFKNFIDYIFNELELPLTKQKRLEYQKIKNEANLKKINEQLNIKQ